MSFKFQQAVPVRASITLALEQIDGRIAATIMLSRNNELRTLVDRRRMTVAEALRRAKEYAAEYGFPGYEISDLVELTSISRADLTGAFEEIQTQVAEKSNFAVADPVSGRMDGSPKAAGFGLSDLDRLQATLTKLI